MLLLTRVDEGYVSRISLAVKLPGGSLEIAFKFRLVP